MPDTAVASREPVGRTEPRIFTPPLRPLTRETTLGYAVAEFMRAIGEPGLPWHEFALIHGLELGPGCLLSQPGWRFRFRTVLVLAARQNGKTWLSRALSLYFLFILRVALVCGTAQDVSVARRILELLNATVEAVDDLLEEKVSFRRSNGNEALVLTGHREYVVKPAHADAGRSLTVDLLILDELRTHRSWAAWSALTKTTNARPNGMVWAFSNAGDEESVVLNALQANGQNGTSSSLCLMEWSAPEGCPLDDEDGLLQANPSVGFLTTLETLLAGIEVDPPDVTRTEVLCQRVASLDGAVDLAAWRSAADEAGNGLADAERLALCLDVSPEDGSVILVGAAPMPDGRTQVQVLKTWTDIMAALADVPVLDAALRPDRFGWFPSGPAAAMASAIRSMDGSTIGMSVAGNVCANDLCEHLTRSGIAYCCSACATADEGHYEIHESGLLGHTDQCQARQNRPPRVTRRSGYEVVELTGSDVTELCQEFAALVAAGQVVHSGDKILDGHIAGAKKWNSGDGWRFVRRGQGNVHGAYAAAGAVRLARNLPPPRKRVRLVV